MKRTLFITLLILLLCYILPTGLIGLTANAETSGYYTYTVSNGEATITDCDDSISGDITVPSTLGGYPVKTIGSFAFYKCSQITNIIIPDSITEMIDVVFEECTGLKSVIIGRGITSIGTGVFNGCSSLTSITIPDSVTHISNAFYGCNKLKDVYYAGSICDKEKIHIPNIYNEILLNATWHYGKSGNHIYDDACDSECNNCGYTRTVSGHSFSVWDITKTPTCEAKGEEILKCTKCSHKETREIDAKGHNFGEWQTVKKALCAENGSQFRKCNNCTATETKTTSATGHSYSKEWTVDIKPTCITLGSKSHHCLNCESKIDLSHISPIGHKFGEWQTTKEATTKMNGEAQRNCINSGCSELQTKTIAKLALDGHSHVFGEWEITEASTCTESGSKIRVCKICGEKERETISRLGHKFGEPVDKQETTETEKGIKTLTCTVCGKTKEEVVPSYLESTETSSEDATIENNDNMYWIFLPAVAIGVIGGVAATIIILKKKTDIIKK